MPDATRSLVELVDDFSSILANDPGPLAPDRQEYVHNLHGAGVEDQVALLERQIRLTRGGQLYYFSGMRGTGKSTELKRLELMLNGRPNTRAYVVDALDYISDTHELDTLDLLLVVAAAFAHRLSQDDALGEPQLDQEGPLKRFSTWLQSDVEIQGATVAGIKVDFKRQQQSIIQRIRAFDLARQERVMAECQAFITDMADAVRQKWKIEKVVLMVDSLERLRGVGSGAAQMFERIVKVFYGDERRLRVRDVQMVFSVPPYLPYLTNVKAFVQLFMLASVRVCQPPDVARRQPRPEGLDALETLVTKRFADWQRVLSRDALHKLCIHSGGDLRQLLRRLLASTLEHAAFLPPERLPLQAGDEVIQTVLDAHRVDFEDLVVQAEYPLLKSIAERNALELPERSDLPVLAHFFDLRAVLNYRNGKDWLDINPLLWPLIDSWTPPAPHASPAAGSA
ncbi:hypothetical protein [Roseateles sp. BYS96W]|uniref:ATP-binding protein n=1 Tax=Pelomonas nitida TaxID=3299027 RepID=A0ABW7G835_9BURK